MKNQAIISPLKPEDPKEMFVSENYLDSTQNVKEKSRNSSKNSSSLKRTQIKKLKEIKERDNKHLSGTQENTNTRQKEMTKTCRIRKVQTIKREES